MPDEKPGEWGKIAITEKEFGAKVDAMILRDNPALAEIIRTAQTRKLTADDYLAAAKSIS